MYKLSGQGFISRLADGALIPPHAGNVDYQAYLAWLEEGNTAQPVDDPTPAELAAAALAAKNLVDAPVLRNHTKLQALAAMSPAQVQAWVSANVTNLAQAQDAIATLAVCVGFLARRL